MAIHSSILAWRISGTGEPGGLPSMRSHRVGHDWSDLAAAALENWASLLAQSVNNLPVMQETWVRFLDGKIPGRRKWLITPVFLPGESHRQGSLTCYGPWGPKSWTDLVTKPPPLEDFLRVSAPFPSHQPSSHGFALDPLANSLNLHEEIQLSQCIFLWQSVMESQSMGWFPKSRTNLQLESDITWAADHLGSLWSSSLRRGIGVDVTLITMANKDLLYSMGNYTQYLVIMYNGEESKNWN